MFFNYIPFVFEGFSDISSCFLDSSCSSGVLTLISNPGGTGSSVDSFEVSVLVILFFDGLLPDRDLFLQEAFPAIVQMVEPTE